METNVLNKYSDLLKSYTEIDYDAVAGLPGYCYGSEEIHKAEVEMLKGQWLCVGRIDEAPQPGDFYTFDLLGEPLIIVRDEARKIRVLSNVCRHRGMPVVEGRGRTTKFLCPYHAWSYGLDGGLLRAPRIKPGSLFDPGKCTLPELRSQTWQGFIYVNLNGRAKPLRGRLKAVDQYLRNYRTSRFHHVFVEEEVWPCNWKALVENFMEGYHLSVVHPQTLGDITPTRLCEKLVGDTWVTGYRAHYPDKHKRINRHPKALKGAELHSSTLFGVFPTHMFSQSPNLLVYMSLQPESVHSVRVRWGVSTYEKTLTEAELQRRINHWKNINREDKVKLGRLKDGQASAYMQPGPLAPEDFEGTIADFYRFLANQMG